MEDPKSKNESNFYMIVMAILFLMIVASYAYTSFLFASLEIKLTDNTNSLEILNDAVIGIKYDTVNKITTIDGDLNVNGNAYISDTLSTSENDDIVKSINTIQQEIVKIELQIE
jgi:flagellar basal body-associated protein FliL